MSSTLNLFQKINEVQKIVTSIVKDGEIEMGRDSYQVVTHDSVSRALHGPLASVGIVAWPDMDEVTVTTFEKEKSWNGETTKTTWYRADVRASVTYINSDKPDERLRSEATAIAFDTADKAIGKAYSMAIKTIHLKTFILESLDKEEERSTEDARYTQKPRLGPKVAPPKPAISPAMGVSFDERPNDADLIQKKRDQTRAELRSIVEEKKIPSGAVTRAIAQLTGKKMSAELSIEELERVGAWAANYQAAEVKA